VSPRSVALRDAPARQIGKAISKSPFVELFLFGSGRRHLNSLRCCIAMIREAIDDSSRLAQLQRDVEMEVYTPLGYNPSDLEPLAQEWRVRLEDSDQHVIVALRDGILLGLAVAVPYDQGFDAILDLLYVRQDARRGGLARQLIRAIAVKLIEANKTSLLVGVWQTLDPAISLYQSINGAEDLGATVVGIGGQTLPGRSFGWRDLHNVVASLPAAD
jgi:GNAT superfamily N-acetyltransferase